MAANLFDFYAGEVHRIYGRVLVPDAAEGLDWGNTVMNSRAQGIDRAPKTKLSIAEYFQRNFVVTTSGVEDPLALDHPYQPTKPAVDFMDAAPVTDAQRHKLYHESAERVVLIAPLHS